MVSNKLSLKNALKEVAIACKKQGKDEKGILINQIYFLEKGKAQTEDTLKEILKDKKFIETELKQIDRMYRKIEKKLKEMGR